MNQLKYGKFRLDDCSVLLERKDEDSPLV